MFGSYLAFEVEAERRREVLADSMREARRDRRTVDGRSPDTRRSIEAPAGPPSFVDLGLFARAIRALLGTPSGEPTSGDPGA